ncbi:MAG: hypothetical protein GY722_15150 [bacterium]|nr:hypothetical protein [bacterium]
MVERHVLDGWQAHLHALHDIARLIPFPYGASLPDIPVERLASGDLTAAELTEIAEIGKPGRALLAALLDFEHRVPARCPKTRRKSHRGSGTHELLAVHRQRLVIAQTRRPPPLPSGWRGSLYWIVDLELVEEEGQNGISIDCCDCNQLHAFNLSDLLTIDSTITPKRNGPPPAPDGYPPIEESAFAEVWGHLTNDEMDLPEPQLTIIAPRVREAAYREAFVDNPAALSHLTLIAGYKQRIDLEDGHVTTILPPDDPNQRVTEGPN